MRAKDFEACLGLQIVAEQGEHLRRLGRFATTGFQRASNRRQNFGTFVVFSRFVEVCERAVRVEQVELVNLGRKLEENARVVKVNPPHGAALAHLAEQVFAVLVVFVGRHAFEEDGGEGVEVVRVAHTLHLLNLGQFEVVRVAGAGDDELEQHIVRIRILCQRSQLLPLFGARDRP